MSKAVPWATLVRMIGSPSVTLTARCIPKQLQGDVALVVIHGHHGVEPAVAGVDHQRVGRQRALRAAGPSARPRSTAGRMTSCSSSPNRPPSPPCGFSEQTPIRGRAAAASSSPPMGRRAAGQAGRPRPCGSASAAT